MIYDRDFFVLYIHVMIRKEDASYQYAFTFFLHFLCCVVWAPPSKAVN